MIYVVSAGNQVTGGPETLHQFASKLADMNIETRMVYFNPRSYTVPERYKKYNIEVVGKIEDKPENIIVVPETLTFILKKFKKIKKCIWWLSLDNYLNQIPSNMIKWKIKSHKLPICIYPFVSIYLFIKRKLHFNIYKFEIKEKIYCHLYNCEYVKNYLINKGVKEKEMIYLCGPINDVFFNESVNVKKENIVLYNPQKGREFTEKIILEAKKLNLDYKFIPIVNMTPSEIRNIMARSKIYIDFGEFPGPERIPREAVTLGCNIITGLNGSASNDVDIPIDRTLKFSNDDSQVIKIINKIKEIGDQYNTFYPYYDSYRDKVIKQKKILDINIKKWLDNMGIEYES